jgi:type IV secretion system protein VirD4
LLSPEEVRTIPNENCILFVRGEAPIYDRKFDLLKHPNVRLTTNGGAEPYVHNVRQTTDSFTSFAPDNHAVLRVISEEDKQLDAEHAKIIDAQHWKLFTVGGYTAANNH